MELKSTRKLSTLDWVNSYFDSVTPNCFTCGGSEMLNVFYFRTRPFSQRNFDIHGEISVGNRVFDDYEANEHYIPKRDRVIIRVSVWVYERIISSPS